MLAGRPRAWGGSWAAIACTSERWMSWPPTLATTGSGFAPVVGPEPAPVAGAAGFAAWVGAGRAVVAGVLAGPDPAAPVPWARAGMQKAEAANSAARLAR